MSTGDTDASALGTQAAGDESISLRDLEGFLALNVNRSLPQRELPLSSPLDATQSSSDRSDEGEAASVEEEADAELEVSRISTHALVWPLKEDKDWEHLHEQFAAVRQDNLRPWFRCLGVLRGLGARTVVIETYYVCLDYKSEHAAFYAHLDASINNWAIRLHFFAEDISDAAAVTRLTNQQREGYLGYIVCREPSLPLVGRTLIKLPEYLTGGETTAILETVNFYGQRLQVRGVPFMQQDQRFATCAHVAVWTMSYTAYRRGTSERRLVADLVGSDGAIYPLRPRTIDGLYPNQVAASLSGIGFRVTVHKTPNRDSDETSLPHITWGGMPSRLSDLLGDIDIKLLPYERDLTAPVLKRFKSYSEECDTQDNEDALAEREAPLDQSVVRTSPSSNLDTSTDVTEDSTDDAGELDVWDLEGPTPTRFDPDHPFVQALDGLLDFLTEPYLRSGWPVYLGTSNHALVLCGRTMVEGRPMHFVHDDQIGPYLITESLPAISREGLRYQSGSPAVMGGTESTDVPPTDRVREKLREAQGYADLRAPDTEHEVHSMVVAVPARVLLSPTAALNSAAQGIGPVVAQANLIDGLSPDVTRLLADATEQSALIVMGIDYKANRRHSCEANKDGDDIGVDVFSSVQLSEWVILVEGTSPPVEDADGEKEPSDAVVWECVFDASSSDASPRLLLARVDGVVVTSFPGHDPVIEAARINTTTFPRMNAPDRVGKVATDPA